MLFHFSFGYIDLFMDGHHEAAVALFPCSLSQGFKKAAMGITLISALQLFSYSTVYSNMASIADTGLNQRCLISPAAEMAHMAGDRDVFHGSIRRCLVWPETTISRLAGDDCWLWNKLMSLSRTWSFIYILALWPSQIECNEASHLSLFQQNNPGLIWPMWGISIQGCNVLAMVNAIETRRNNGIKKK